jgi:hypothetical protein
MPAASLSTPRAAPSTGLTRAPVASARSTSRSVSRGSGVAGSLPGLETGRHERGPMEIAPHVWRRDLRTSAPTAVQTHPDNI